MPVVAVLPVKIRDYLPAFCIMQLQPGIETRGTGPLCFDFEGKLRTGPDLALKEIDIARPVDCSGNNRGYRQWLRLGAVSFGSRSRISGMASGNACPPGSMPPRAARS